jgi:hypothetical protein
MRPNANALTTTTTTTTTAATMRPAPVARPTANAAPQYQLSRSHAPLEIPAFAQMSYDTPVAYDAQPQAAYESYEQQPYAEQPYAEQGYNEAYDPNYSQQPQAAYDNSGF